jgi:hypothetical protein
MNFDTEVIIKFFIWWAIVLLGGVVLKLYQARYGDSSKPKNQLSGPMTIAFWVFAVVVAALLFRR